MSEAIQLGAALAIPLLLIAQRVTLTRRGGLLFFRLGRFGGSVYVARRP